MVIGPNDSIFKNTRKSQFSPSDGNGNKRKMLTQYGTAFSQGGMKKNSLIQSKDLVTSTELSIQMLPK
jgi:hypothetical protein